MTDIVKGRMTAPQKSSIVVFLIGARVNRWWKIHRWLKLLLMMPKMVEELKARPNSGLLAVTQSSGAMIQYWSSVDALLDYAKDRSGLHYPTWRAFNRLIGDGGDVGVWHETYVIDAGASESIYVNMPPIGLGKVFGLVPAVGPRARARDRLAAKEPGVAVRRGALVAG